MSFVPGKEDFAIARFRAAFPYFLILWLGIVLSLTFLTFSLKRHLQDSEMRDINKRLDSYLADNPLSGSIDIIGRKGDAGTLQGLAFLRLVKGGDQVLLAENSTVQVDFHQLAGLDPKVSGVWITLSDPDKLGPWTIAARKLAADIGIQVGKEDSRLVLLYERLVGFFRLAAFLGGIPALGLALSCAKAGISPMRRASADIAAILADGRSGVLLPEKPGKDLSDLYGQLNQLFLHNRRLIGEMQASLDNVAHDLRTPMTRLRAVAEYGLQADAAPERLRDALSDCLEESERVLSMLKIMMTVAEAESGTMHLQKEWINLVGSLMDVVSLYEYVAEEKKIAVRTDLQPGLRILADRTRVAQVWANLLDNSIKYGKEGGYVVISSESDGEDAVIVFTDDGIGISKNEIHRIWERLYRGDRSRTQPGLGLGLNYVRAVVEAHGGTVDVESELQKGTRLTVRLKETQHESAAESMKRKSQISGA
jgi:signal transduction histidine kinase